MVPSSLLGAPIDMSVHMSAVPSPCTPRLRVHAQSQTTPTSLSSIAFARHVALCLSHGRAAVQLVSAEALAAVFCACHAESLGIAVSHTLSVGNRVLTDIGKGDASKSTIVKVVGVASGV
jgi:hypothetical protein